MKSWHEFNLEEPELARLGKEMLFPTQPHLGLAFLATIRKDGAPRLHPISLVYAQGNLYVFIPPASPKCADLKRDGRYALQAFPPPNNKDGEEYYLTGIAHFVRDLKLRQQIIANSGIVVAEFEQLFEFFVNLAMYTVLADCGTQHEHPIHRIWPAGANSQIQGGNSNFQDPENGFYG
jgi:hypothetical protein